MTRVFTFVFFLAASFSVHAGPALRSLEGFYSRTQSLETAFAQRQFDEKGETLQSSTGSFALARPGRFRWEYVTPYRQSIISDGSTFWFYDVDLAQVTKRQAASALQGTPALLLSGGPALHQQFRIIEEGSDEGLQWLRLVPKQADGDFKDVRMGLRDGTPRTMELRDHLGQLTRIEFSNVRVNPRLRSDLFAFRVPAGVEVVDGDAATPPASPPRR
jgi:outer membrane lipoprotein carrier protein